MRVPVVFEGSRLHMCGGLLSSFFFPLAAVSSTGPGHTHQSRRLGTQKVAMVGRLTLGTVDMWMSYKVAHVQAMVVY